MQLLSVIASIHWNVEPEIFSLGPLSVRWYGLCWVVAFALGIFITTKMFKKDGVNPEWVDSAFMYVFIGTVLGARLGHVFFYNWSYYSENLLEIPMIWKGGLASHGAAIGIVISLWLYSKYVTKRSIVWMFDRVVIPVAIGGAFVRLGNFFNHEIYGYPTDLSWGVVFKYGEDALARHPSQIYEALSYLIIFCILLFMFFKTDAKKRSGLIFGVFLILLFAARFFIEFIKENQETFEDSMSLNMGQWLSVPFIVAGIGFIVWSLMGQKKTGNQK